MDISAREGFTIIGYVVAWAATVFAVGRGHGRLTTKVRAHDEELARLRDKEIGQLYTKIDKLHACFVTADGEPRLMSYSAHDKIQAECRRQLDDRHANVVTLTRVHDEKIDRVLEELAALRAMVARLENR